MTSKAWVRLLCLILCLTVLMPCVSALGETTKVAAYLLRLREKPSSDSKVLDAYPRGTKVTILKKGTTWTRVQVHGKTGYMKTDLLAYGKNRNSSGSSSSKSSKSSGTGTSITDGTTAYIVKGVRLNLRDLPSNEGDIIGSYRGGTKVTVLKKGKIWSLVEVKGKQGYMGTDYLTYEPEE